MRISMQFASSTGRILVINCASDWQYLHFAMPPRTFRMARRIEVPCKNVCSCLAFALAMMLPSYGRDNSTNSRRLVTASSSSGIFEAVTPGRERRMSTPAELEDTSRPETAVDPELELALALELVLELALLEVEEVAASPVSLSSACTAL